MKSKGFTLIELLVVVAIIGILATVVLSSLSAARSRARVTQVLMQVKEIEKGLISAALEENRNTYWTSVELGGVGTNNVNLSSILLISTGPGATVSNYLGEGSTKYFNGERVRYRNFGSTLSDCSSGPGGVHIEIPTTVLSPSELSTLNNIVDGEEVDVNCGKIRSYGSVYRYIMSSNPNALEFN